MNKLTTITATIILAAGLASCGSDTKAPQAAAPAASNLTAAEQDFVGEMLEVDERFADLEPKEVVELSKDFCKVLNTTTTPANAMEMLYGSMDKPTAMLAAITMAGEDCPGEITAIAKYTGLKL